MVYLHLIFFLFQSIKGIFSAGVDFQEFLQEPERQKDRKIPTTIASLLGRYGPVPPEKMVQNFN